VSRSQWAWAKGSELVGAAVRGARRLGMHEVLRERLETERPARKAPSIPTLTWVATAVILIAAFEPAVALGRSASRGGRAPVARTAQYVSLTSVANTERSSELLAFGSGYATPHGLQAVRRLQRRLANLGYAPGPIDGRYGPLTERAVIRFQTARDLRADGIAGPRTLAALAAAKVVLVPGAGFVPGGSGPVRALQRHLAAAGFSPGPIDGRYGPLTERAVIRFQTARHLHVDGIAGPQTLGHLERTPQHPVPRRPTTGTRPSPARGHPRPPRAHPLPTHRTPRPQTAHRGKPSAGSSLIPWAIVVACVLLATLAALLWHSRRRDRDGPRPSVPPRAVPEPVKVELKPPRAPEDPLSNVVGEEFRDAPRGRRRGAGEFMFGRWFASDGDLAGARDSFWRAHNRGHPDAAFELGMLMAREGDWSAAEEAFEAGDERGHAGAAFSLGVLAEQRGDLTGARMAYRRAAERGDPEGAYNLGQLLEREGDPEGAKAAYARAEQRGHAGAAFSLGALLLNLGDPAGAEEVFARADARGDRGAACNHGILLEDRGDLTGARLAYSRAEARGEVAGSFNLGQLLEQQGDRDGAKAAFRRADQRGDAGAAYHLGRLLEQEGDREGAKAAYARADERAGELGPPEVAELAHTALRELGVEERPEG